MKNLLLILALLPVFLFHPAVYAQTSGNRVARECVLIEGFTGVNCGYCPGSAAGLSQMIEEGLPVTVIEYHTSDFSTPEYYAQETNARSGFYSVFSYPTTFFDGVLSHVGGGEYPANIYPTLMGYYNQRVGVPASFYVDLVVHHLDGSEYSAVVNITPAGTCSGTDQRVMIAFTQSNIPEAWGGGMTHLECVCRDLMPDENGTAYTGGKQTVTEIFDIQDYPVEDLHVIAWIQDFDSKEVYQSVIVPVNITYYATDMKLQAVEHIARTSCSGKSTPLVTVKNIGTDEITSFDLVASMNGSEVSRISREGESLGFGDYLTIEMPEFSFPVGDAMNLEVSVESPNGMTDMNPGNNSKVSIIGSSPLCNEFITLRFKTDDNPEETTVEVMNMTTGETVEQITYSQPDHLYNSKIYLDYISCYRFSVYDSGGDGIDSYFSVRDKDNQLIFNGAQTVNPFSDELSFEMHADEGIMVGIEESPDNKDVTVWPNPAKDWISITGENVQHVSIYNLYGVKVLESNDPMISTKNLADGMYFLEIEQKNLKPVVKRVLVNK